MLAWHEPHSVAIIGAGKLGRALACLWRRHLPHADLWLYNRHDSSRHLSAELVPQADCSTQLSECPSADVIWLTTPDTALADALSKLLQQITLQQDALVLHCSGPQSSSVLNAAKQQGAQVASWHPLRAFASPQQAAREFSGTYCALEGDPKAVELLQQLSRLFDAQAFLIETASKAQYHAAAVMASNYVVTLAATAQRIWHDCGLEAPLRHEMILSLMHSTLKNLESQPDCTAALTGPLQRGDQTTVQQHLAALPEDLSTLYAQLGLATLPLTSLSTENLAALRSSLHAAGRIKVR